MYNTCCLKSTRIILRFKISVLIMREKVISSMMAVDKGPEIISAKISAGE